VPRYYFKIEDGRPIVDSTGEELSGHEAARRVAVEIMSEVMADHASDLLPEGRLSVEVSDHTRQAIFSVITTTAVRQTP
jgi:hypothetical protein